MPISTSYIHLFRHQIHLLFTFYHPYLDNVQFFVTKDSSSWHWIFSFSYRHCHPVCRSVVLFTNSFVLIVVNFSICACSTFNLSSYVYWMIWVGLGISLLNFMSRDSWLLGVCLCCGFFVVVEKWLIVAWRCSNLFCCLFFFARWFCK